ncbi:MAG: AraC family transcriptional regulator [Bacteroidia bacterium]
MINLHTQISANPAYFKQLSCGESLITLYDCPLENKFQDLWSQHSYIVYVVEGRKIWHTPSGSYDLQKGSCVLIKKGACIVEQFFDSKFCLVLFFIPDHFICEVLKGKTKPLLKPDKKYSTVISVENNESIKSFFDSMLAYFGARQQPDSSILDLKFRELILTIADNPTNAELLSYFCDLMKQPKAVTLQSVMEENYCYNLKLEGFAELAGRSLSSFKRDFQDIYKTTPAKWLLEKRLEHAHYLLVNAGRNVSEASFESGFENLSHFSREFSKKFGVPPGSIKS